VSLTARAGAPARPAPPTPLPLVVAGAFGGAAAGALSYGVWGVVALAAWMLDPGGPQEWTHMLEAASAAWLAGLGLAPTIGGISVSLLPLGFAVVLIVSLMGAARWACDASAVGRPGEAVIVALSAAAGLAVVAAVAATLSRSLEVSPTRAAMFGAALAFVVFVATILHRIRVPALSRLPVSARDVAVAAGGGLLVLVMVACVALAASTITQVDKITALLVDLDPGPSGVLLLLTASLGYLPLAITWGIAYLLGPGVHVAVGSVVSPYAEPSTVALPGFPLLAVLPGAAPSWAAFLPVVGVVAGFVTGALLRRRGHCGPRNGMPLAAGAALLAGAVVSIACWLSSGAIGTMTLVDLGPPPLAVGGVAAGLIAVGALAVSAWPKRGARG
jgi:hypothetical protein